MNDTLSEALNRALVALRPDLAPPKTKKVKLPDVQTTGLRKVHLVFQEGNSDKEYIVQMAKVSTLYEVRFEYGRRGGTHTKGTKTDQPCSLVQANTVFDKLVQEKKKKGYKEI